MKLSIKTNFPEVAKALKNAEGQVPFATSVAINKAADKAKLAVQKNMRQVFDRPTPFVINSLRLKRSTKQNLTAELQFKDKNSAESSRTMVLPHVDGGSRRYNAMEARLRGIGVLPDGWNAVPGAGAKLDSYGNMSRGQISQMLNLLGAYKEAGYNKANAATRERLAKGNAKKNIYGFVYWVNPVGTKRAKHLQPGVYQRVTTGFGSSLKPVVIFVKRAQYSKRLPFYQVAEEEFNRTFPEEFNVAMDYALRTAFPKVQGNLL